APPATTRAAVTTMTVPLNVMRYGPHPCIKRFGTAGGAHFGANPEKGTAASLHRTVNQKWRVCPDVPRTPRSPNHPQFELPRINSLLTTAKRRLAERFLQVHHAPQARFFYALLVLLAPVQVRLLTPKAMIICSQFFAESRALCATLQTYCSA